jgi:YbgC/YbaW family acyl-CoA thioester hydrolase
MLIEVRFTDTDAQGNVNHTAIIEYIAHARVTLLDGMVDQSGYDDLDHVLVSLQVDFLQKIYWPETVRVTTKVISVGNKSVTTEILVCNGEEEVLAKATCVNVFFVTYSGKTHFIPDELRKVLLA